MSGPDDDIRDDEDGQEADLPMSLSGLEIESLERLTYCCRIVEYKREKFSVDARRQDNWLSFKVTSGNSGVEISFFYDVQNNCFATLQGASIDWVKDFLMKYRILED